MTETVEKVPNIVINGYLECPICLDYAVTPINTCLNGHVVCGICKERTLICPTCQAPKLTVNGFIERILKSLGVVVPCRNVHFGCSRKLEPSEMKDHLANSCDLRPIKCTEAGEDNCDGKFYSPNDLFKHWLTVHNIKSSTVDVEEGGSESSDALKLLGSISTCLALEEAAYKYSILGSAVEWPVAFFELDGHTFFRHACVKGEMIHMWITFLGEDLDAKKYKYKATVSSLKNQSKKEVTFTEILVHSMQYNDIDKVDVLGDTIAVRCNNLKNLVKSDKYMLEWEIWIDIFKVLKPSG